MSEDNRLLQAKIEGASVDKQSGVTGKRVKRRNQAQLHETFLESDPLTQIAILENDNLDIEELEESLRQYEAQQKAEYERADMKDIGVNAKKTKVMFKNHQKK